MKEPTGARGAVLVVPTTNAGQQGPVAALVSTAGWAAGAQRVLGRSWIITPDGVIDPDEARRRGSAAHLAAPPRPGWKQKLPTTAETAAKDLRQVRRGRRFTIDDEGPWTGTDLAFVWQRHELFHTAGIDLARRLRVPSVLFVPATPIWEARGWGVRRPGWERLAERRGEAPSLQAASLVAAGSDEVAEQVVRLGTPEERILIVPTGVDLDLFRADADGHAVRERLGLADAFVVGWAGSFRRFHALDLAVEALEGLDGAVLLLVGDGPERIRIEELARTRGVRVVTTGTVAHADLPAHLAAFDVGLVQAPSAASFHYSPLKVAEYLAAGRAVVAPRVPQLADRLVDGVEAVLVPPGDARALADALRAFRDAPDRRAALGRAARAAAERDWSWDRQIDRIVGHLRDP